MGKKKNFAGFLSYSECGHIFHLSFSISAATKKGSA